MADMIDATGTAWHYASGGRLRHVLPVEETVFALAAVINEMVALEDVQVEIEVPGEYEEQERGYWVGYWDGSFVRREAWEVRSALVRGLRVDGKKVRVDGMCEGCREALGREVGVEVETVGAVEVPVCERERGRGERMLARNTTPIWVEGRGKRGRGSWV